MHWPARRPRSHRRLGPRPTLGRASAAGRRGRWERRRPSAAAAAPVSGTSHAGAAAPGHAYAAAPPLTQRCYHGARSLTTEVLNAVSREVCLPPHRRQPTRSRRRHTDHTCTNYPTLFTSSSQVTTAIKFFRTLIKNKTSKVQEYYQRPSTLIAIICQMVLIIL